MRSWVINAVVSCRRPNLGLSSKGSQKMKTIGRERMTDHVKMQRQTQEPNRWLTPRLVQLSAPKPTVATALFKITRQQEGSP